MGSFVIVLREGFEAALMVGLILAFLDKTGQRERHGRAVWAGTIAALISSVVIGAILFASLGELEAMRRSSTRARPCSSPPAS